MDVKKGTLPYSFEWAERVARSLSNQLRNGYLNLGLNRTIRDNMSYKGKIYKLMCNDGYFYFGSTRNELCKRLYKHKYDSRTDSDRKVYKHILGIGWDKVRIILVEDVIRNSQEELLKKESDYIEKYVGNIFCLNSCVSFSALTQLQRVQKYQHENPDKIIAYREANREDYRNYAATYRKKHTVAESNE